jgi:hypothetical protein
MDLKVNWNDLNDTWDNHVILHQRMFCDVIVILGNEIVVKIHNFCFGLPILMIFYGHKLQNYWQG